MNISAYRIGENKRLDSLDLNEALENVKAGKPCVWIDIESPDYDGLEDALRPLGLHQLVLESCLEPHYSAPVAGYHQCLLIRLPYLQKIHHTEALLLSIICLHNAIITVHLSPAIPLQKLADDFSTGMRFQTTGPASILFQIIDRLIDQDLTYSLSTRRRIDTLEDKIEEEDPDPEVVIELRHLKELTTRLTDVFEEQRFSLTKIQSTDLNLRDFKNLRFHFRDTIAHLEYATTSVARQRGRLTELHQHYILKLEERTNRRLKILTVLSSIFMPLTLITGIYGMNFRYMPELNIPWAYPAALASMALLSLGLLWNFYRKGWFD